MRDDAVDGDRTRVDPRLSSRARHPAHVMNVAHERKVEAASSVTSIGDELNERLDVQHLSL